MLLHDFLVPLGLTQAEAARAMAIPFQRLNGIVNGRRAVSPSSALRFARYLGTSPELWLTLQARFDLYAVLREEQAQIESIEPRVAA